MGLDPSLSRNQFILLASAVVKRIVKSGFDAERIFLQIMILLRALLKSVGARLFAVVACSYVSGLGQHYPSGYPVEQYAQEVETQQRTPLP